MKQKPYVFIMAGGSGTRLWPFSRTDKPKQLLTLYGKVSLLQHTIDRAKLITSEKNIFIGTNKELMKHIRKTTPGFKSKKQFILEPEGKNTAPAIALFITYLASKKVNPDVPLLILSADHFISPAKTWAANIQEAYPELSNRIFCLGVETKRPDTGYGYIEAGPGLGANENLREIESFREKPDSATAEKYHADDKYLWNSGVFLFSLGLMLKEFDAHQPAILETAYRFHKAKKAKKTMIFAQMPNISIDYAIMEKSDRLAVISSKITWDDVGSYEALSRIQPSDKQENYTEQAEYVNSQDSKGNIILADKPVNILGIENCIIVEKNGMLLVASRGSIGKIKELRETAPDSMK